MYNFWNKIKDTNAITTRENKFTNNQLIKVISESQKIANIDYMIVANKMNEGPFYTGSNIRI